MVNDFDDSKMTTELNGICRKSWEKSNCRKIHMGNHKNKWEHHPPEMSSKFSDDKGDGDSWLNMLFFKVLKP